VIRNKRLKPWFIFILFLIGLSAIFVGSCRRTGVWLAKEDALPHADAMILLMGSFPERVLQSVDLYHEGIADRLIIVYV